MISASKSAMLPSRGMSVRLVVALLLMASVLATGAVLGVHNYRQTSRLVLEATEEVFARTGREVVLALGRTAAPVQSLVDVLAAQSLADARTHDERFRHLPALVEALRRNAAMTAIYAGYDDGAFILVRPSSDPRIRAALRAPESTAFVVQSVEATPDRSRTSFHFLRDDLTTIAVALRPDFTFDPRTREWYRAALRADRQIRTDPYVFFTTREPGVTFARASPSRRAAIGADVTLEALGTLLQSQKVGEFDRALPDDCRRTRPRASQRGSGRSGRRDRCSASAAARGERKRRRGGARRAFRRGGAPAQLLVRRGQRRMARRLRADRQRRRCAAVPGVGFTDR